MLSSVFTEHHFVGDFLILSAFGFCFLFSAVLYKERLLTPGKVIIMLTVCGFVLRLVYALRYGYQANQHDVEGLTSDGHLSYIFHIFRTFTLPKSNDWQFCHPPLHHFLAALSMKLSCLFGLSFEKGFENIQLLTVFYSTLMMTVGYKLLCEIKVNKKLLPYIYSVFCFHPVFSVLAGSINNDCLSILLASAALLYTVKWYNSPTLKNALLIGVFTGLGMMTKFSVAIVCVATGVTVLYKFIKDKQYKLKKLLPQSFLYLFTCLPLGLWYQVRNLILFGQPIGYVAPLSTESALYTGEISIVKRLILPFAAEKITVYSDVWNEYNVWFYLVRNSLFGEYKFGNKFVAALLVLLNAILILLCVTAFVILFKKKSFTAAFPLTAFTVVEMLGYIYLNASSPFGCSMDFRYIVPVLFSAVASLAYFTQFENKRLSNVMQKILQYTLLCFSAVSVVLFL